MHVQHSQRIFCDLDVPSLLASRSAHTRSFWLGILRFFLELHLAPSSIVTSVFVHFSFPLCSMVFVSAFSYFLLQVSRTIFLWLA